jgi:uncharacterized protein YacL
MPINLVAVVVAIIAAFIVGWLWYSPVLFGRTWMRLMGVTPESMKDISVRDSYLGNILGTVIMAVVIAVLFSYADINTPTEAISWSLLIWLGIVMPFGFNDVVFGKKHWRLWFLNGGHQLLTLLVMGYIIALWK